MDNDSCALTPCRSPATELELAAKLATTDSSDVESVTDAAEEPEPLQQRGTNLENGSTISLKLDPLLHQAAQAAQAGDLRQQEVANHHGSRSSSLLSPSLEHHQQQGNHFGSDSDSTATRSPPPFKRQRLSPIEDSDSIAAVSASSSSSAAGVQQIKALIDFHRLSREQFMHIYDEYIREREKEAQMSFSIAHAQAQAAAMLNCASVVASSKAQQQHQQVQVEDMDSDLNEDECTTSPLPPPSQPPTHDVLSSRIEIVDVSGGTSAVEEMDGTGDSETGGDDSSMVATPATLIVDGDEEGGPVDTSHVGKMQSLVKSALESFETASPVMSEIGQKRKHFTLEEELRLQPSSFAQQLLERDQTLVAQAIKRYMNQYSIPQREVVEKTGLNQSHLSQHFLHGVTMKRAKRIKLYHWFEDDQKARTGKLQSADGSLNAVLESPKVEGSRRRPRWKWSPISTQILTEAFKKNQFPTREQRLELSRVCNDAELAMNNGAMIRGPEGDTEGITEQRINTWFTNRRKGLSTPITPSPTKALTPGGTSLPFTAFHPTLLRAGPATTPVLTPGGRPSIVTTPSTIGTPKFGSLTTTPLSLSSNGEEGKPSPVAIIPSTVQTLVSQIQQAQVHQRHHPSITSGGVTMACAPSAQVMSSSPSSHLQNSPHLALPLAIALPGGSANVLSTSSSPHTFTTAPTPMHTVTVSPNLNPNAIHALLSQLHGTSGITAPLQLATAATVSANSGGNLVQPTSIITLPPAPGHSANQVHLHNHHPPPPLTSNTSSASSSPFISSATSVNAASNAKAKALELSGGKKVMEHVQTATTVPTLSQAQLQAFMSQVQGAKVIDGTSPLAQFQLLTLPAGISLATPPTGPSSLGGEPQSVLWAANAAQGVPQTS